MAMAQAKTRAERAQHLPVIQIDEGVYFIPSSEGKIAYRVSTQGGITCTCADFVRNGRSDPEFCCKHILAVLNSDAEDVHLTSYLEKRRPKLEDKFVINLKGKDFVLYAGLLDLGHQKGIAQLETSLLQYPSKENGMEAIAKATAVSKTGEVYTDIGDANPKNTNKNIAPHLIRMASTRAKARVLRDMANIGMTALEELGDFEDVVGGNGTKKKTAKTPSTAKKNAKVTPIPKKPEKPQEATKDASQDMPKEPAGARPPMSEAQKRAIANLSRRRGISEAETENMAQETFGCSLDQLDSTSAASFIRQLQQSA